MIFNWSTWKMDPTPAGDVILWRSREDAEPLQCWALWWRARLPRHRGDRTSVDCVGVLGGAKRWRIFWVEKRKAGLILMDFNGFYTQTIKERSISVPLAALAQFSSTTADSWGFQHLQSMKSSGVSHLWVGDIQNKGPPSFDIRSFIIYNPIYDSCRDWYPQ